MRFIHTSDWHLGRLFHGSHLTDDQSYVLEQFVDLVKDQAPEAVLIAGDIYDRAVPPPEAVSLLDEVLTRIVVDLSVPVLLIAGNHDSPERLAFGSRVFRKTNLHAVGSLTDAMKPVVLEDKFGEVEFFTVPYSEPPLVREFLKQDEIRDHNAANSALLAEISQARRRKRAVVMTHAFVAGGMASESERPLSIGGSDVVDVTPFLDFSYVALGHLHRPQKVGADHVRYSGSLMKYSFSEADQRKLINIVELDGEGQCTVEEVRLKPRHDVRAIRGLLHDLLTKPDAAGKNDYLSVELLDDGAIYDAIGQLRTVYPNVLHIERRTLEVDGLEPSRAENHRKLDDVQLFQSFFSQVTGEELSEEQSDTYRNLIQTLRMREREAAK